MTGRIWSASWSGMKGAYKPRRKWMTWGEFDQSLRILGVNVSRFQVRRILAHDPPAKAHNGLQYEMRHLKIVTDWAKSEEANMTDQQRRESITSQDEAIERIGKVIEAYKAGGLTYSLAHKQIEQLLDEPARVVRVGTETHTPEVTT